MACLLRLIALATVLGALSTLVSAKSYGPHICLTKIGGRSIKTCCAGWKVAPNNLLCMPHCEKGCPTNADCVAPNTCACHPGYTGHACDTGSPEVHKGGLYMKQNKSKKTYDRLVGGFWKKYKNYTCEFLKSWDWLSAKLGIGCKN